MALFARGMSVFIISNRNYSMLIMPNVKSKTWNNLPSKLPFIGNSIFNVHYKNSDNEKKKKFVPFDDLFKQKRDQARRSILVQLHSNNAFEDLYSYCSTFGKVNSIFCCKVAADRTQQILVEFEEVEAVDEIMKFTTHEKVSSLIPVHSSFLFFRKQKKSQILRKSHIDVPVKNEKHILKDELFLRELRNKKTTALQMKQCYSILKLDELGLRLRFQIANQLERCLSGLFPEIEALPFGSSVNGFGKMGCDLDLYINFQRKRVEETESRFVFQSKYFTNEKDVCANYVRTIGDLINIFLPGARNVVKVSNARVPIIKFNHIITGVECDISFSNMSAVYMSELLYLYGEIDSIVRPLVFTIRLWAKKQNITKTSPGFHITNFTLTLMILFYLQQKKILPSLNELKVKALKTDLRITDTFVDCTFLRDISNIQNLPPFEEKPFSLLQGFFNYYASFDYKEYTICLREGKTINFRMDQFPISIRNPFEKTLNVSRNVSKGELDIFRIKCRDAAFKLENASENPTKKCWGILGIFERSVEKKSLNLSNILDDSTVDEKSSEALFGFK